MSFFNDFFELFDVNEVKNGITVSWILGVGFVVVGDVRLGDFSSEKIVFVSKKTELRFFGCDLKIKTMCKGEIVVNGKVDNVEVGEL